MGCIALEDIEIGTLILKEKFQCIPKIKLFDVSRGLHSYDDFLSSLMDSFFSMNINVQEEYLTLYNKYLNPDSLSDNCKMDYFYWKKFAQHQEKRGISNARFHIDRHFILKIICIFHTNGFNISNEKGEGIGVSHQSVGIKTSRFNHSCSSNSEYRSDICTSELCGEIQIRATIKIKKGEEICLNYFPFMGMKNKKERQAHLQNEWDFICSCERCQDEEINKDDETYEKFQKLQEEAEKYTKIVSTSFPFPTKDYKRIMAKNIDLIGIAISCYKQMIKLAENKKAPKWFIYKNIIIKWFELEYNCRYGYTKEMIADYDRYGDYDIER